MTIKDLMSSPVKTCRATALTGQAARIMLDEGYGCLPVVDSRRRLAGMISIDDVIRKSGGSTGPRYARMVNTGHAA